MKMNAMRVAAARLPSLSRWRRVAAVDLAIMGSLIALDVAARLAPHAPDFTPLAVSALFAATVLRCRVLSLVVPVAAMMLGDAVAAGFYDWRIMAVVYGALTLPAGAACLSARLRRPALLVPVLLASSLAFFALTNFAVWAFTPMYPAGFGGLIKCYTAALPFLRYTVGGDLFWGALLFGGYRLARMIAVAGVRRPLAGLVTGPGLAA